MTYVDPNSGAAPQPGGFAGIEGAEKGFAVPASVELDEDTRPSEYETPGEQDSEQKSVQEIADEAEKQKESESEKDDDEKQQELIQAQANPKQTLAEIDESGREHEVPESGSEEKQSDDGAIEHQAVDPSGSSYDPDAYGVDAVNKYIAEHPDERDAIVAKERKGKSRKGITGDA